MRGRQAQTKIWQRLRGVEGDGEVEARGVNSQCGGERAELREAEEEGRVRGDVYRTIGAVRRGPAAVAPEHGDVLCYAGGPLDLCA